MRPLTATPGGGRLARNVVAFARLLRDSGLPIGLDQSMLIGLLISVA